MKQRVLFAILTLVLLGAGFGAGIWTERRRPLPPPPFPFMGEMPGHRHQPSSGTPHAPLPQVTREQLAAEIERLRPEIESFRKQIDQIEADYEHGLLAVLSPVQRELYATHQQRRSRYREHEEERGQPPKSISAEQIARMQQRPMFHVVDMVVFSLRLDWLIRELKLDEAQREKVRGLLRVRRDRFLALVDSAPLSSLFLSRLAPAAERLHAPAK